MMESNLCYNLRASIHKIQTGNVKAKFTMLNISNLINIRNAVFIYKVFGKEYIVPP